MGGEMKTASVLLGEEFGTISDLIHAHACERPAAVALVEGDERISYGQLDELMDRVATALQNDGLRTGDIVAICAKTSIEYCAVFFGALRAGIAVAPISPSATPKSILSMIQDCDAKILFLDKAVADAVERIDPPKNLRRVALDSSSAGQLLSHWLAPAGASPSRVVLDPNGIFNIIYSSGTTGEPKGIVHSHQMRWKLIAVTRASAGYNASSASIVYAAVFQHYACGTSSFGRLWRQSCPDGQVRSSAVLAAGTGAPCDARHAGPSPIPSNHGRTRLRLL